MQRWIFHILALLALLGILGTTLIPADAYARRSRKITISDEDALRIKGKIIRPEMELILQRSKINFDALKLKESFLPRIIRSVKQEIF